jgi:hypothetical protein
MIFPKELNRTFFEDLLRGQPEVTICCVLLDSASDASDWSGYVSPDAIASWADLLDPSSRGSAVTPYHAERYQDVLKALTSDPRTFYILERHYRTIDKDIFFNSIFNRTVELELIVWNTLTLLYRTKPDRIVHYNVPHGKLWFVTKIAELLGVEVLAGAVSPLPWKEWVVRGIDVQQPVVPPKAGPASENGRIADFIAMIRGSYDKAMPSYEKERFDYFRGGFFSVRKELRSLAGTALTTRSLFALFIRGLLSVRKRQVLQRYAQLTRDFELPEKFIVFFLHYQPERTTLPEGHGFAQQWLALRNIVAALPPGYKLLVKEHPSTFRYYFHPGFRNVDFHAQISRLPNTCLVPLNLAPYALIDRAVAVATVTGTVGIEALIRGKPVIVFGAAQYRGQQGVYSVGSMEEVRNVLAQVVSGAKVLGEAELEAFLHRVDRMSFAIWDGTWPGVATPDLTIASREVMRAAIFAELPAPTTAQGSVT